MKNFQEAYHKAKVLKDMDEAIDNHLSADDMRHLISCLDVVKEATGLDMRQDYLLGVLKAKNRYELSQKYGFKKFEGFVIYADIDDNGKSFTVYNNYGQCIGTFLADDKVLKDYKDGGAVVKYGIDNRESSNG